MGDYLIQDLMDEVYDRWNALSKDEINIGRLEVIQKYFSSQHKAAVQLGNMNYQITNGGFQQWFGNGYLGEDLDDLVEYCKRGKAQSIPYFKELTKILLEIKALGDPDNYTDTETVIEDCIECQGRGYIITDDEKEMTCKNCNGSGEIEYENEINGQEIYCEKLDQFNNVYYDFNEDELFDAFDEFLNRFDEQVEVKELSIEIKNKPRCKLVGEDGNVFSIISRVSSALRKAGQADKAMEFRDKALKQHSYDSVLALCFDYVEVF